MVGAVVGAASSVVGAMATQYVPRPALLALQRRRLRHIVHYAFAKVPFYRDLWHKAGVRPEQIRELADLVRLPIPDRRAIESNQEDLQSRDHVADLRAGQCTSRGSGGSSGGPRLFVAFDRRSWRRLDAYYLRALCAVGYRPWQPLAYYWGMEFDARVQQRIGLMPKVRVPAQLDEAAQMDLLEQHPRTWLYYHPVSLFALARRYPERLRNVAPPRIVATAELLLSSMRRAIEEVAGCPVFDQHGSSEFNRMFWECERREGYHVDVESIILEIVDDAGNPVQPGERGRALVTGLINEAMPLIRYEMGDLLVASDRRCACGRTLPMIESIEGRVRDVFRLPDGGTRTPRELLEPYGDIAGVEQYRLTIASPLQARLEYVTTHAEVQTIEEQMRARFAMICPGVGLEVVRVPSIEKTSGGKRVMLRNQLSAPNTALLA